MIFYGRISAGVVDYYMVSVHGSNRRAEKILLGAWRILDSDTT